MTLHLVPDEIPEPTLDEKLATYGAAYVEAAAIAEACRVRLLRVALAAIDAGMGRSDVAARTGVSVATVDLWRRRRAERDS